MCSRANGLVENLDLLLSTINRKWPAEKRFKAIAGTNVNELPCFNLAGKFGRVKGKTKKARTKFIVRYDAVDVLELFHNYYVMRNALCVVR